MKNNQKGFSVVEVLVVVVIIGLIGAVGWLVYDRQKKEDNNQSTSQASEQNRESEKQQPETPDPYDGWSTYSNDDLGYSFKYPNTWKATRTASGAVQVDSDDLKTNELPIGAIDVSKGSRVTLNPPVSGDYAAFSGMQKQLKDNGTIKPMQLTLGSHKAIEFAFGYESPETTYIRLALNDSRYIESNFASEGQESAHKNFELYKKLLASIK